MNAEPGTNISTLPQSRLFSFIESVANVLVGITIAVITQIIVFPWFGINVSILDNVGIAVIFTGVSLLRSYLLRRYFNRIPR